MIKLDNALDIHDLKDIFLASIAIWKWKFRDLKVQDKEPVHNLF